VSGLVDFVALAVTAAGLLVGVGVAMRAGARTGAACLLEFLLAAGLLRLAGDPQWDRILGVAAIVSVRHLLVFGLSVHRLSLPAGKVGR
jgi:hypothetical protein